MWDECGMNVGLVYRHRCPIDHVNGCEIFTRLHHFDIVLGCCCCWSRGIDMYVCTCQQPENFFQKNKNLADGHP